MQFQWTAPLKRVSVDGEIYLHLGIKSTGGEDQKTQGNKLKRAVISLASKRRHRYCIFIVHHLHKMLNFTGIDGFTIDTTIQLLLICLPLMKPLFLNEKKKVHQLNYELSLSPDVFWLTVEESQGVL